MTACPLMQVKRFALWTLTIGLFLFLHANSFAAQVTLAWDANNPVPEGYRLYQSTQSGSYNYNSPVWSGAGTTCTIGNLTDSTTYYFVVRAYEAATESGNSNEVSYRYDPPAPSTYTITAAAGANGHITPSGSTTVTHGGSQAYSIVADAGYQVLDVRIDGTSAGPLSSYTFSSVTADHTITAAFTAVMHTISAQAGEGGTISPSGQVNVADGGSQSFSVTPDSGCRIEDLIVDGNAMGAIDTYTFNGVNSDHSIEVRFVADNQPPVADAGPDQTVDEAQLVQLNGLNSIDPDDGIAAFQWRQIEGPTVNLDTPSEPATYFTAPNVDDSGVALVFELTVTDHANAVTKDTCIVNVTWVNEPPTAQAGADQTVQEGARVTLDAGNSVDPDDGIAIYLWEQLNGPEVMLSDAHSPTPFFDTPDVGLQAASLTFQLTVTDASGLQDTDTCLVTVTWVNAPPNADAGPDQQVLEYSQVVLDGANSVDPDDGIAAYQWTQTDGQPVVLSDATAVAPTFEAPEVGPEGGALVFRLTVTDTEGLQHHDTCIVNISSQSLPPTASAGGDQNVTEGGIVRLDGTGSTDRDDGIAAFLWTQTGGPSVVLDDPQSEQPEFTAPDVGPQGASLTFGLTVVDYSGLKSEDTCVVNVTWQNVPPVADAGPDRHALSEAMVTLDGSASYDGDDGIASYRWKQISGPSVTILQPNGMTTGFKTPEVAAAQVCVFQLTVVDNGGLQGTDSCEVEIEPGSIPEEDTTPPEIQVLRPDDKFVFVMRPRIAFKGTADDNRRIERVTWSNDRGGSGVAEGTTKWRVDDLRLKRWMNEITFTAYDAAGNRSSVKVKVFAWFWR